MRKFTTKKYEIFVRESMTWKIYRSAQGIMALEFGKISANLGEKTMKSATVEFGLDISQKVEDYYVPLMIKKITSGDSEYTSQQEIQEIVDEMSADEFKSAFDYCKKLYDQTVDRMSAAKKKK